MAASGVSMGRALHPDLAEELIAPAGGEITDEHLGLVPSVVVIEGAVGVVAPIRGVLEVVGVIGEDAALHEEGRALIEPPPEVGAGLLEKTFGVVEDVDSLMSGSDRSVLKFGFEVRQTRTAGEED